ncbi:MAG: GIY-YIG nuclease family protein [Telluria sp.]
MNKPGYVYMLADDRYGTLYIGVTSNLPQRVAQHRLERTEGFTKKYNVKKLVWYECHDEIGAAILREKQLKKWRREWKIRLIHSMNPMWNDLYPSIL